MLQKQCATLVCLTALAGTGFAGGPDPIDVPEAQPTAPTTVFYLEGNVGAAWQNWKSQINELTSTIKSASSSPSGLNSFTNPSMQNENVRMMYGADAGWQALPALAVEGGFYIFNDIKFNNSTGGSTTNDANFTSTLESWIAYLGVRVTAYENSTNNFRIFAKLAATYSNNHFSWTLNSYTPSLQQKTDNTTSEFWTGMAALGFQFDLDHHFYLGAQGMYVLGSNGTNFKVPDFYSAVATLGMRF